MSGKFVNRRVHTLVAHNYYESKYYIPPGRGLNKADTYLAIFGAAQHNHLNFFLEDKTINVLYKSKEAVNGRAGHGVYPRNTLVIFELADVEQQVPAV